MLPFKNKQNVPISTDAASRQAFVQQTQDSADLLHKELLVNQAEQAILKERISVMRAFMDDLSVSDPQYGMFSISIQIDQIELDELKTRELIVQQRFSL
jgi:hypothetical protein